MRTLVALLALAAASALPAAAQTGLVGWHADGQTWLVWTNDRVFVGIETYDIYVSDEPITDLSQATLIGRLFPQDWDARRLQDVDPSATWTIPDGAGGTLTLAPNEALFVYTPHAAVAEHFAVVKHGETSVGPANTTGPIAQTLDPVTCHPQWTGTTSLGYPYTVYAHWVDGRDDHTSGRPDYAVMGNAGTNGTGHLFTVYEPPSGLPPGPVPALMMFHGGLGSHLGWVPGEADTVDNTLDDGLMIALDDVLYLARNIVGARPWPTNTFWFGHWEGYDRFDPDPGLPPDDALVVDYTLRRVAFIHEFLVANFPIDPQRVSAMGHSMGAGATAFVTRRFPDLFAAGMAFEHAYRGIGKGVFLENLLGTREQNLQTTLPGGMGFDDFMQIENELDGPGDRSFARFLWGRNDEQVPWNEPGGGDVPATMRRTDATNGGQFLYWDERTHTRAEWAGEHWDSSPRLSAEEMTRHRADRSYPALGAADHDPGAPGRQPDPGDGDPLDGDPAGTWGGYFDWDTESITDTAAEWSATIVLISGSPFPNDDAPTPEATADVTIRKAQAFRPAPGASLFWTLRAGASDEVLTSGPTTVSPAGRVTVEGLSFSKTPPGRRLVVTTAEDGDLDDVDAQIDCDDANGDVWSLPGEVRDLRWSDASTLHWTAPAEPGGKPGSWTYDLVRSPDPAEFEGAATCVATAIPETTATDLEPPDPGGLYAYLVVAANACGRGAAGETSSGASRAVRECP